MQMITVQLAIRWRTGAWPPVIMGPPAEDEDEPANGPRAVAFFLAGISPMLLFGTTGALPPFYASGLWIALSVLITLAFNIAFADWLFYPQLAGGESRRYQIIGTLLLALVFSPITYFVVSHCGMYLVSEVSREPAYISSTIHKGGGYRRSGCGYLVSISAPGNERIDRFCADGIATRYPIGPVRLVLKSGWAGVKVHAIETPAGVTL